MSTERQKMMAGELYDPFDPELVAARARARDLCQLSEHGDCTTILLSQPKSLST